jgi:hypothetical protein
MPEREAKTIYPLAKMAFRQGFSLPDVWKEIGKNWTVLLSQNDFD